MFSEVNLVDSFYKKTLDYVKKRYPNATMKDVLEVDRWENSSGGTWKPINEVQRELVKEGGNFGGEECTDKLKKAGITKKEYIAYLLYNGHIEDESEVTKY